MKVVTVGSSFSRCPGGDSRRNLLSLYPDRHEKTLRNPSNTSHHRNRNLTNSLQISPVNSYQRIKTVMTSVKLNMISMGRRPLILLLTNQLLSLTIAVMKNRIIQMKMMMLITAISNRKRTPLRAAMYQLICKTILSSRRSKPSAGKPQSQTLEMAKTGSGPF